MKSDKHIELAHRAIVWLESRATNRGIRGCEEICLGAGYVADSVAISGLTMSNEKLFVGKDDRVGSEPCDDYAWIFESKVSRGDFNNTFKNGAHIGDRLSAIGNFHFVVTPSGLVQPSEVPLFWGLLEQRGAGLSIKKMPQYQAITTEQLHKVAYQILRGTRRGKFMLYSPDRLIDQYRQEQEMVSTSPTLI